MFSLWRPLCLYATIYRYPQISRVTHSKDGPASLCALHKNFKPHVTIQRCHSSHLVKDARHEGFKTHHGLFIKRGDTVELEDGNFIQVLKVLNREFDNKYWIVGWRFARNGETHGLPRHDDPNEVHWVVHLAKNDPRPAREQALEEVEDSQIRRKRTMKMVNTTYLGHRKKNGAPLGAPSDGALFCRWKHVICTRTPKRHRPLDAFTIPAAEITEASFQRLRIGECDDGHNIRIADEPLRRSWRGVTKKGGAGIDSKETSSLLSAFEALSLYDNSENKRTSAAYTFADVCCGAGGASRGAEMAGLHLCWALDHNAAACESYSLNFSEVQLHHKEIKDVVNMQGEGLKVDILHLSPPCQAFSPARTHPNVENDLVNIAANMELGNCLDVAKPRIATLEQTSGLMSGGYVGGRHHEYWVKVIEQFTSRGYSVAWKIMKLAELGLPQPRERLIMIASCPGEDLPHFPKPAHAKNPGKTGLQRFASVKDAIGNIPIGCANHEIPSNLPTPREVYDENEPLPGTILTKRSFIAHPNGLRSFSLRELACLQGFLLKHMFCGTEIMKQIGNAFPPTVAAVLFGDIKLQLLIRDGLNPL